MGEEKSHRIRFTYEISPVVLKNVLSVEMLSIFINIHLFQYYKNSRRVSPLWVFILSNNIGTGSSFN